MTTFVQLILVLVALKAILIGSEFNFFYFLRYGRRYWDWYNSRPSFQTPA